LPIEESVGQTNTRRSISTVSAAEATYDPDSDEPTTTGRSSVRSVIASATNVSYSAAEYRSGGRSECPKPGRSGAMM
jgi:hypothetical protein